MVLERDDGQDSGSNGPIKVKRNWLHSLIFNDIALINADVRVVSEKRMKRA